MPNGEALHSITRLSHEATLRRKILAAVHESAEDAKREGVDPALWLAATAVVAMDEHIGAAHGSIGRGAKAGLVSAGLVLGGMIVGVLQSQGVVS